MMISFIKVYAWGFLPPAILLLLLLLVPFPPVVAKQVVKVCDLVLFSQPHPNIPLSLFWTVFSISAAVFLLHLDELMQVRAEYFGKSHSGFEDRDRMQTKMLGYERNCWISGCNMLIWIFVHRYRSLLKKYFALEKSFKGQ